MGNPFKKVETQRHVFSWQQVAIALVKAHNIHDGLWRVGLRFADGIGLSVNTPRGLMPATLTPVAEFYLSAVEPGNADALTIDASKVNPEKRILMPAGVN